MRAETRRNQPVPRSNVSGIVWPAFPNDRDAATFALLAQLEMSQWWSPETLLRHQLVQATGLLRHAAQTVPFYRDRLTQYANRTKALTLSEWQSIPLLSRSEIQDAGEDLASERPPAGHDGVFDVLTSGSTGAPVRVKWNKVVAGFHAAITLRDHLWHGRNPSKKFGVLKRLADDFISDRLADNEARWAAGYRSGPMVFFDLRGRVNDALDWLAREEPDYLMVYPTYLRSMILRSNETGFKPSKLRQVAAVSEVVDAGLRKMCEESWGARVIDMYSAQETGFLALECPDTGLYHIQSECYLVEVLDERGRSCAPGETGRIVATPLHNFSVPLIRYDLGDYAEVGEACGCGRGLPVLRKIHGRSRNMMKLADGSRHWIALTGCGFEDIAAIRQVQLIQKSVREISLRLVVSRPLTEPEVTAAREAVCRAVRQDFDVTFDYVDEIPRSVGGKFEDVISEVADELA